LNRSTKIGNSERLTIIARRMPPPGHFRFKPPLNPPHGMTDKIVRITHG
jgi:hypothetical protein